jgi:hypothetical protein
MHCPVCKVPLFPEAAWKSTSDRFYCSRFCADSETIIPPIHPINKQEIDQRYVERLERLIPLRRLHSPRIPAC